MAPAVTVVIPSRDRPTLVRRAATCALAQVDVDVDVIVVDDGSEIPLADALGDLVARANGRLQVVRTPVSEGVSAARNRGVQEARGEWVGFCDDDDFWAPTKARAQVWGPTAAQATWSCSGAMAMGPDLAFHFAMIGPSGPDTYEALLSGNVIPAGASSVIARTSAVRETGGFDTNFSALADWDMWVRLAQTGPLHSVHHPLVAYLVNPEGMSRDTDGLEADMTRLEAKYAEARAERGVQIAWPIWQTYVGRMHLRAGRRWEAVQSLAAAARARGTISPWRGVAVAAVSPSLARARRDRRGHRNNPPAWNPGTS